MNIAARQKAIKPLDQLYPLPGSKADAKYSILSPDPDHAAICQPFMGSAARSLGCTLPSYLGEINAAQRSIAMAWKYPDEFTAAYNDARDFLIADLDVNLLANYTNQRPFNADHPEAFQTIVDRWKQMMALLFAELNAESIGLAGRYYFALKASFGQVMRLNPKGTGFNSAWHIDKLNGAIKFNPSDWCLRMALTPFDATVYDCWERAIEAPPNPAKTMLILDPPYGVDTEINKITACYLDHQISGAGQTDTLLNLAIAPLKQAIELGYQTIYLCNYRSAKLEEAIEQLTSGFEVTRHDFGECRSLGNSAGRLSHGKRKDNRAKPVEAIWEIRASVGETDNLQKAPESPSPILPEPVFCSSNEQPTEKKSVNLALQLIDALSEEVDQLKADGIASASQYLNEQAKGDRTYYLLRWVVRGQVKSKSLKPSEVSEVRSRIARRNEAQSLDCRISEIHKIIQKLEVKY
jgi:hypothetical protein